MDMDMATESGHERHIQPPPVTQAVVIAAGAGNGKKHHALSSIQKQSHTNGLGANDTVVRQSDLSSECPYG